MELAVTEEGDAFATLQPKSVPAWRVAAGNCAAGATAGVAVEAGAYPLCAARAMARC